MSMSIITGRAVIDISTPTLEAAQNTGMVMAGWRLSWVVCLRWEGRSLLVIVPVAVAQTLMASLMRISAFTLGIVFAMSVYGLLAGGVLRHVGEAAAAHTGNVGYCTLRLLESVCSASSLG